MDIFKRGDKVWFEYEISGHSYERCGFILDGPFDNGFYRIRNTKGAVDFYIHKDKIHYERPDKRIKELEEAYSKAEAMCDNSEPRKVCKTCKNRECGLDYTPCTICEDHNMWESTKVNPFKLGDLVKLKDASKPVVYIVVEIKHERNAPDQHYLYDKYSYSLRDKNDPSHRIDADHDELEKVDKQYTGGYIYPVGARVRFKFDGKDLIGYIQERRLDHRYRINVDEKFYIIKPDYILGYAANWIDDPSIRKAFGVDVRNDIYEDIKKQINKDQLNFHYGLHSIFPLAPNDAAEPLSYSTQRKLEEAYLKAETMYGLNFNQTFYDDILKYVNEDKMSINDIRKSVGMEPIKEDNMKNTKLIRSNGTYKKEIKNVIFSGPVTTVVFEDELDIAYGRVIKSKTNVRCQEGDEFDKTTGFLLALVKTFVDKQSYDNILRTIDGFEEDELRKECKENIKLEKKCEDDWKFMVGDLVRLKSGNIIFKVVRTLTWNYNGKVIHRYAIRRFGGSKYITYENENRLTLVEPTTDRLTKSMIKE